LVAMADRETLVNTDMPLASSRINRAWPRPALPTTNPNRKNNIIPRIVKILGVKTPAKVPRVPWGAGAPDLVCRVCPGVSFFTERLSCYFKSKSSGTLTESVFIFSL
jgi:hypothetical protein